MEQDDAEQPIRHIFRWDLDKTYLRTEFDTLGDLLKTALQRPEDKVNVPGAVTLLRELTRPSSEGRSLVTFVSGSPTQMRATLEKKFELDGIQPDIFILKPTLQYILRGQFAAVRGQVGYKLDTLLDLRSRSDLAPETMFGDDAEQDAFIYSLYADISAGRMQLDTLRRILLEADVHESARHRILERAELVDTRDTTRRIFIHLEEQSPPGRFWVFGPRVVPIVNYFQAALILVVDDTIDVPSAARIAAGLRDGYDYGVIDLANSIEDLVRRRHLAIDDIDQMLAAIDDDPDIRFFSDVLRRGRRLAPRDPGERPAAEEEIDYMEILKADRRLRSRIRDD